MRYIISAGVSVLNSVRQSTCISISNPEGTNYVEDTVIGISSLLNLRLRIPDHTTLSRRSRKLNIRIPSSTSDEPFHIMIDSTGLRIHTGNNLDSGPPKRRAWRKLHLVVDSHTGNILASSLTTHRSRDAAQVPALLAQIDNPVASVMADGAYDSAAVYTSIEKHSPEPIPRIVIPPRRDAHANFRNDKARQRNAAIQAIDAHGRKQWAQDSGCTRRSLVETAMQADKLLVY